MKRFYFTFFLIMNTVFAGPSATENTLFDTFDGCVVDKDQKFAVYITSDLKYRDYVKLMPWLGRRGGFFMGREVFPNHSSRYVYNSKNAHGTYSLYFLFSGF